MNANPEFARALDSARSRFVAGWPYLLLFVLTGAHVSTIAPTVRLVGFLVALWFVSRSYGARRSQARKAPRRAKAAQPNSGPETETPAVRVHKAAKAITVPVRQPRPKKSAARRRKGTTR